VNYLYYIIFLSFGKLLAYLPLRALYVISDMLYPFVYYIVKYRKKVVFENLQNAFPEKNNKEIEIIAKKFYRHFCDLLVETVKLLHISKNEISRRVKYRDPETFMDEYKQNKHILVVLGHYNNWEWGIALGMQRPYKFASIYKPLTNKYFDELMNKIRAQFGGTLIPMSKIAREMVRSIQGGELTIFNFIADQAPVRSEIQYWTKFLNQDTPVYLGIEKLAQKTNQPVYFGKFIKVKRGYYEAVAQKLCDNCSQLQPHELTEKHIRALEETIREAPEYWLWSHRRWKIKKNNI
jgi:Kdo2-lipid IVA lauroyltransferase/acyltransferase